VISIDSAGNPQYIEDSAKVNKAKQSWRIDRSMLVNMVERQGERNDIEILQ